MSVNLTSEEQDFLDRYLSGNGANADTEWRARFMMKGLLDKLVHNQKQVQVANSRLRPLIESIILKLPNLNIPVDGNTTDEALCNELVRVLRIGLTAQKELNGLKRISNIQNASNNPVQQRSLVSDSTYQSSLPSSLLQPDNPVVIPFKNNLDVNPFEDFMSDFALNAQKPNGTKQ